jgi:hypothetical protein
MAARTSLLCISPGQALQLRERREADQIRPHTAGIAHPHFLVASVKSLE